MLGSESSTLLSLPGAKVPRSESSTYGTFAPGSESTRERKFHNSYGGPEPAQKSHDLRRDLKPCLVLFSTWKIA